MKYETLEKFINGEKIEDLTPIIEFVKEKVQSDVEFYNYFFTKYPPIVIITDTIGYREFLLAEWMGKLYPCWTTGHSDKKAPCLSKQPIPFAIIYNGKVYGAEGKTQYWHYDDFEKCNTIEEFKQRIKELKEEFKKFIEALSFNSEHKTWEHTENTKTLKIVKSEPIIELQPALL
jgi:hypothetical protein